MGGDNNELENQLRNNLGKISHDSSDKTLISTVGYIKTPTEILPSKGMFNSRDLKISKRPLNLMEVKHYSSMNKDDYTEAENRTLETLERGYEIIQGGERKSIKILKETDKLFLLFDLRDITMHANQREVKIMQNLTCPYCGKKHSVEVKNSIFSYYDIPKGVMKYYDENERCFIIKHENLEDPIRLYIPDIGTQTFLRNYIYDAEVKKSKDEPVYYDSTFLSFAQFLIPSYEVLNNHYIENLHRQYTSSWSYDKFEVIKTFSEMVNIGIKPSITIKCDSETCKSEKEVRSVLRFRGGLSAIFNISNIAQSIFED